MRQLFESVLELRGIQERFHSQSQYEMKRRKDLELYIEKNGTCNEIENNDTHLKEVFLLEVNRYENIIKEIYISYKASFFFHLIFRHVCVYVLKNIFKYVTEQKKVLQKTQFKKLIWKNKTTL